MRGAELDGDEREGDLYKVLAHCSVAVSNTKSCSTLGMQWAAVTAITGSQLIRVALQP